MIDVCCLQVLRGRGQGTTMLGMEGSRYNLWWSGKKMEFMVWEVW